MKPGPLQLLLDSAMIGIVTATALLIAILVLDVSGTGQALARIDPWPRAVLWLHLTILATPFGTLALLARDAR
ncbi:MAG: hypothetical protein AAF366_17365 [Pseudomonadota bacterium]